MNRLPQLRELIIILTLASLAVITTGGRAALPVPQADRFEDVPRLSKETIPANGKAHPDLKGVDAAILEFMAEKGIPATSFALSKNGNLIHSRAFGWADPALSKPLMPGRLMRLASITKPITRAAVQTLLNKGVLLASDRVFDVLELGRIPLPKLDARWKEITLQHLIDHRGGWDRTVAGDFTYKTKSIAEELKVPLKQLQPGHIMKWALDRPLDYDPGAKEMYCNFGYVLLARIVEKKSGMPFVEYLRQTVGKTAGMYSLTLSRSDPEDRVAGELWYCLHPGIQQPQSPQTLRFETKDGSEALACSAEDYCHFLDHFSLLGNPRVPGRRYYGTFFGSTPGVTSACSQRRDGVCYVVICNRRPLPDPAISWTRELKERIDRALDPVAEGL